MKILGIDVGITSIKAVELDSAFGRYEIHEYHEQKLVVGADPVAALNQMIQSLARKPDKIIVAMPTGQVTFRNLTMPTRDKKAIQAGVGFELEDELPFSMEQAVFDYSILSQTKNSTQVHIAATLEKHINQQIAIWNSAGVDPEIMTTESWGFRTLFNRIIPPANRDRPILLAQIGHDRTVLYVHYQNNPVLARELAWGGRELTTAISQRYKIPIDHAEQAKLEHGFVIPDAQKHEATPEQVMFSDTLMQPLQTLIWELRQAELTCKKITHQNLGMIYLAGGTALLPGLGRVIEETLKVPARPLQSLSSLASSGVTYSEHTDATFITAGSLALCLVGSDRTSGINLRKGRFSKKSKGREINIKSLRRPLMAVGAVSAALFVSLFAQSMIYQSKLKEADVQLEKSVRSFFGQLSSSAAKTYLSSPSTLRKSIEKELNKQRELSKILGPNQKFPVDFLKEISSAIPKDVIVDMTQFQVGAAPSTPDDATTSLSFIIYNVLAADRLNSILGARIGGMQKSKLEEIAPGENGQKRWKVTFSGKLSEDSYGK